MDGAGVFHLPREAVKNRHHVLMGRDHVAVTGFGRMRLGLQVEDLYYLMRKVMEKHDWD